MRAELSIFKVLLVSEGAIVQSRAFADRLTGEDVVCSTVEDRF